MQTTGFYDYLIGEIASSCWVILLILIILILILIHFLQLIVILFPVLSIDNNSPIILYGARNFPEFMQAIAVKIAALFCATFLTSPLFFHP